MRKQAGLWIWIRERSWAWTFLRTAAREARTVVRQIWGNGGEVVADQRREFEILAQGLRRTLATRLVGWVRWLRRPRPPSLSAAAPVGSLPPARPWHRA